MKSYTMLFMFIFLFALIDETDAYWYCTYCGMNNGHWRCQRCEYAANGPIPQQYGPQMMINGGGSSGGNDNNHNGQQ